MPTTATPDLDAYDDDTLDPSVCIHCRKPLVCGVDLVRDLWVHEDTDRPACGSGEPKVGYRSAIEVTTTDGIDTRAVVTIDYVKPIGGGIYRVGANRPGSSDYCRRVEWYVDRNGCEVEA